MLSPNNGNLGQMYQAYQNGLNPEDVKNYDETDFVFNKDDGRVLDFSGTKQRWIDQTLFPQYFEET